LLKLVASLVDKAETIRLFEAGADIVLLETSRFNPDPVYPVSLDLLADMTNEIHAKGKRVFALMDGIVWENELATAREYLGDILSSGVDRVVCYDFTFVVFAREMAKAGKMIYRPKTYGRHPYDSAFYERLGLAGLFVPYGLASAELKSYCLKSRGLELGVQIAGAEEIYRSRRSLMNGFYHHAGMDGKDPVGKDFTIRENTREDEYYHIRENPFGTTIWSNGGNEDFLTDELIGSLDYGYLERRFSEAGTYYETLAKLRKRIDGTNGGKRS